MRTGPYKPSLEGLRARQPCSLVRTRVTLHGAAACAAQGCGRCKDGQASAGCCGVCREHDEHREARYRYQHLSHILTRCEWKTYEKLLPTHPPTHPSTARTSHLNMFQLYKLSWFMTNQTVLPAALVAGRALTTL